MWIGARAASVKCEALGKDALAALLTDALDNRLPEPLADVKARHASKVPSPSRPWTLSPTDLPPPHWQPPR